MHTRLLLVLALVAGAFTLLPAATANAAPPAPTCGPYITLTPPFGQAGTVVSVNLFQFTPNTEAAVTLRVAGDPVVATGTTDENGHANIIFTMQSFTGSQVAIQVRAAPCNFAGAYFKFREATPTPVPTTPPATATTPATPQPTTPATAAITPTPKAPIAGSAGEAAFGLTAGGANLAIAGLALVVFTAAFVIWGSSRHFRPDQRRSGDIDRKL
ncbi:MAG: hypothetical protein AB7T37_10815 [Dehalococcoidia bacterium]